ncbi:glutamine synthetase [Butyrivibrio fibrisolvens]|uniref:Glutamine synthetase n=1 Tax=Butyrivibrio fibrisolvens TaxID=831 RepID=A0A1H9PNE1_BUTFI|nr:type I glutamate--ammonia ligase [Butyrivibrio fibrisolvens]SER49667.1 glutamine synthetase [Butyrivibrio fibrisolvens]
MTKYTREDIFRIVEDEDVAFIRLQFCDIFGNPKNIAITPSQLEVALDRELTFDGSAVEGFVRKNESEMYLYPDLDSFEIYPWRPQSGKVARMFCDVYTLDRKPFEGDPRNILRRVLQKAEDMGITFKVNPEIEFFLFGCDDSGNPVPETKETAGYFDVAPADMGENVRRDIILNLEDMNFNILSSHHEIAPAQHEIDFENDEAGRIADMIQTFKMAVKTIAKKHGYYATFMPKPLEGVNGSGMHISFSAFDKDGTNIFTDSSDELGLSEKAYSFIAGLLDHMEGISLVTNPLINSYKRLVPGYDAPINMTWTASSANRTSLIRIPYKRGNKTRIELRNPDATCNPYLALALCIAAGLDGIEEEMLPPKQLSMQQADDNENAERFDTLPQTLGQAITAFTKDPLVKKVLGDDVYAKFLEAKESEWKRFRSCVTQWEMNEYLGKY